MKCARYFIPILAIVVFASAPALADCFAPFSVTGKEGEIKIVSGEMRFCDGMHWVGTDHGATANSCSVTGEMKYDTVSTNFQYCPVSGGVWHNMNGASLGTSGGAPVGKLIFDSSLRTIKVSSGGNYYNTARQFWAISPNPDFGEYKEEYYTSENCITSDTATMTGITESIGLRLNGYTSLSASQLSESDINTGTLSYILNGGAPVVITPYGDAETGDLDPEYDYYDELIVVNPNDTLAFEYCSYTWNVYSESQWDGYAYFELYNESNFDDYLNYVENYILGGTE